MFFLDFKLFYFLSELFNLCTDTVLIAQLVLNHVKLFTQKILVLIFVYTLMRLTNNLIFKLHYVDKMLNTAYKLLCTTFIVKLIEQHLFILCIKLSHCGNSVTKLTEMLNIKYAHKFICLKFRVYRKIFFKLIFQHSAICLF